MLGTSPTSPHSGDNYVLISHGKIGVEIALQDIPESRLYDLASLAKCLETAPLALQYLDLDVDRRCLL